MSDTTRRDYQDRLGEEFGATFDGLLRAWASGRIRCEEFRVLFSKVEHLKLLNAITGGGFLWDIQQILWDDLMLRVSRLTDPVRSGPGKVNLTVQMLPEFCDPILRPEVKSRVDAALEAAKFARDWRNRRISHTDLSLATMPDAEPLPPANLQQVGKALDSVHSVLRHISKRLLNTEIANHVGTRPRAGAFVTYTRQLVDSVRYIDSVIDPSGNAAITDSAVASSFLRRLGCEATREQVKQIIELREAARRFK